MGFSMHGGLARMGFGAHGMIVCDQSRRRSIHDEKAEIAAQRIKGEPLAFRRKTVPGFGGHSWREPLPTITHDLQPLWTASFTRVRLPGMATR